MTSAEIPALPVWVEAAQSSPPAKDTRKLRGRVALDFAATRATHIENLARVGIELAVDKAEPLDQPANPALLRMRALESQEARAGALAMPRDPSRPNWVPMGPLAVPNGQTYGGSRVLVSGRVTAIAPHPTNGNIIFIGASRGGVWRTDDGGDTWAPLGDDQPSLAIGALAIAVDDPDVLYAGTGEGNVQYYSTAFKLSSAPGIYLGVGVLRSADGGATWALQASALLANHSFYRIAVDPSDSNRVFAATSAGLCHSLDGQAWAALSNGLPAIGTSVIACTDVLIDRSDPSGNTVYAAFWGAGIYRSTDALAATPTFTQLTAGLPAPAAMSRVSLKQSAGDPAHTYAVIADDNDTFNGLYRTGADGTTWELCTADATIQLYGAFTSDVNVDPTTSDVVYVSGVELYKCVRDATTGAWTVANVGQAIHPDNHTAAIHPTDNATIYAGTDGGFFISRDGGATWDDSRNEGLCLMQYEAIDNHPTSDALMQCGTQDNGTQQFRNSPVHYHSADGDGGYCAISKVNGDDVLHSYYSDSPERSTQAGSFGSYTSVAAGIDGGGLFYPPAAISPTSERLAWGTNVINIDDGMGTGGWPGAGVTLPGLGFGQTSAVSFTNDDLVYSATTDGQVFRLDGNSGTWTARALHDAPLPVGQWIWDIQSIPGDDDSIVAAFACFGVDHVWRGTVPTSGSATWTSVSGGLPDVPMYALCLVSSTEWYVGTDIGVFRTTNAGTSWTNFSQGLPNTAIYDLRCRPGSPLLRAATHGRGLWELRTDVASAPPVDLFVRNNVMDTGWFPSGASEPAAWDDPTRYLALNQPCYWWECADIKTDAPPGWQLQPAEVNFLNFETRLVHEDPRRGASNKVYVQVHNRGPQPASDVTVKIMTAAASAGLPDLPADFWSTWPNSAGDANWTPVGAPQTVSTLPPLRPEVLEWSWTPPVGADPHTCMLVVVDGPDDAISATTRNEFEISQLVTTDKHIGLKNLHLVDPGPGAFLSMPLRLHATKSRRLRHILRLGRLRHDGAELGVFLSVALSEQVGAQHPGLEVHEITSDDLEQLERYWLDHAARPERSWREFIEQFDVSRWFQVGDTEFADIPLRIDAERPETIVVAARRTGRGASDEPSRVTIQQLDTDGTVVGGSTFIVRTGRTRAATPSRAAWCGVAVTRGVASAPAPVSLRSNDRVPRSPLR